MQGVLVEPDFEELKRFLDAVLEHCRVDEKCIQKHLERFLSGEEVELGGRVYRFFSQRSQS